MATAVKPTLLRDMKLPEHIEDTMSRLAPVEVKLK
jgi:hypothetical protein